MTPRPQSAIGAKTEPSKKYMTVLVTGTALFFSAFFLHLIIWRISIPKRQTRALLRIFFGVPAIGLSALWLSPSLFSGLGLPVPSNPSEYLHIILIVTSLTLAYITTYSGMEVDSPSLVMTKIVADAGSEGISEDDFFKALNDDLLVKPRVKDLLRDNLAYIKNEKYRITPKGARVARIFLFYRRLLGVKEKGG